MVKSPGRSMTETGLRKGAWSVEEDQKLTAYINRYGIWNWAEMSKAAGLLRSGKSCRLRWMNYLRPDIKRGNFSQVENQIIIKLQEELGNQWSSIAARLPGRTNNAIKNHWYTHLKKYCLNNNLEVPMTDVLGTQPDITFTDHLNQKNPSHDHGYPPKATNLEGCNLNDPPSMAPQPSLVDVSSLSSGDPDSDIYSQTIVESNGSSESTYEELLSLWDPAQFATDGFDMLNEDYGTTYTDHDFLVSTPQLWGFQDNACTLASYLDAGVDDLWINN